MSNADKLQKCIDGLSNDGLRALVIGLCAELVKRDAAESIEQALFSIWKTRYGLKEAYNMREEFVARGLGLLARREPTP